MHRSCKQAMIGQSSDVLGQNSFQESIRPESDFRPTEFSAQCTSIAELLKSYPRKTYR